MTRSRAPKQNSTTIEEVIARMAAEIERLIQATFATELAKAKPQEKQLRVPTRRQKAASTKSRAPVTKSMLSPQRLIAAYRHSTHNRAEVEKSEFAGCFACLSEFAPSDIKRWSDDGETALCPLCKHATVIGSASGYPLVPEFLEAMQRRWHTA